MFCTQIQWDLTFSHDIWKQLRNGDPKEKKYKIYWPLLALAPPAIWIIVQELWEHTGSEVAPVVKCQAINLPPRKASLTTPRLTQDTNTTTMNSYQHSVHLLALVCNLLSDFLKIHKTDHLYRQNVSKVGTCINCAVMFARENTSQNSKQVHTVQTYVGQATRQRGMKPIATEIPSKLRGAL